MSHIRRALSSSGIREIFNHAWAIASPIFRLFWSLIISTFSPGFKSAQTRTSTSQPHHISYGSTFAGSLLFILTQSTKSPFRFQIARNDTRVS